MFSRSPFPAALLVAWSVVSVHGADDVLRKLDPFLSKHCLECHDDLTAEADFDLTQLALNPSDPANLRAWERVYKRVHDGEMPPKDEPRPEASDRESFLATLKTPLVEADRARQEEFGRVHGRRLTRTEYEHTLHDLLGIDIPLTNLLPAEDAGHGFETVAETQQLSHFHLAKYLAAADTALAEAFLRVEKGDSEWKAYFGPKDLTFKTGGNYRGPEARNGEVRAWPIGLQFSGRMPKTRVRESGWYRITIKNLRGLNVGPDGALWGTLRTGSCSSDEPMLFYVASVEAGEKPRDHTYEAWIQEDHMLELKPNDGNDKKAPSGASGGNISYAGRDLEKEGYAGLAYDGIEMERIYPNGSRADVRRNLLPDVKFENGKPVIADPKAELDRLIGAFASRAFRRPVSAEQTAPYRQLAGEALANGGQLKDALLVGYRAILCSPRFLGFVESPGRLDDHALAARLSYLLWSSLPDETLRAAADAGKLSDPKVLAAQVERMLGDPKSARFVAHFTDQWLNLKAIDFTTPDPRRFREFDPIVQDSMVQETRAFVSELIRENGGVRNFLVSDFAMLNTRLKTHYQLKDLPVTPGGGLQRVSLPAGTRSGLVTQGSVLKVTADGSITSPVLRGIWVNERILGMETLPPPPNIPAVEPDIRGAISIRDQLEKHRDNASCAACHDKIDPAGFALESYDPTGRWRVAYGTDKKAAKVDPSGVTPDGAPFQNIWEWKKIYENRPEVLARAFLGRLLTYGTGAPLQFSDHDAVEEAVAAAKPEKYGVRSLIHAAVASPVFQSK